MLLAASYKINTPSDRLSSKFDFELFKKIYCLIRCNGCGTFVLRNLVKKVFVVHDGPPYANGDPHDGHNLNKVLKDCVVRFKLALGYNVSYILGWDCNGLPIENKALSDFDTVSDNIDTNRLKLRSKCIDIANYYSDRQFNTFKNEFLILSSEYKYFTSSNDYAAEVVMVLYNLLYKGLVYIGNKPNYYSFQEATTLAFSEIEYAIIDGIELVFMFPVCGMDNLYILVMTTQPWTILGNKFVCISKKIEYGIYSYMNKRVICSKRFGIENNLVLLKDIDISDIVDMNYISPLLKGGINKLGKVSKFCVIYSDIAKPDIGTGIVHCAPAHGLEDYTVYVDNFGLTEVDNCIDYSGKLLGNESFAGYSIIDGSANRVIINYLSGEGLLFYERVKKHSYPVSWRNKQPAFIIATEQVFIKLGYQVLSEVIAVARNIGWYGNEGLSTFNSYLEARSGDWSISRQRSHGTPCALIKYKGSNNILCDKDVNSAIIDYAILHGFSFWFDKNREVVNSILSKFSYNPSEFDLLEYVIDVWFDSGISSIYLANKYSLHPDIMLEGRDQHRGWFQTSSLLRYLYDGLAPSNSIVVHGFMKDHVGHKLSKSSIDPNADSSSILYNQEVFRLSVLRSDYKFDICITDSVLVDNKNLLLRVYNLLRYVVNMSYIADSNFNVNFDCFSILVRYLVSKFNNLFSCFVFEMDVYNFSAACGFLTSCFDLLSELIRISKAVTYCSSKSDTLNQEYIHSMLYMFSRLLFMTYPILPVTCCYVMKSMYDSDGANGLDEEQFIDNYLCTNSDIISLTISNEERAVVGDVYMLLDLFNEQLDSFKKKKLVGHNYELYVYHSISSLNNVLVESVLGVSRCLYKSTVSDPVYLFTIAWRESLVYVVYVGNSHCKCQRCWKYIPSGEFSSESSLCKQCCVVAGLV